MLFRSQPLSRVTSVTRDCPAFCREEGEDDVKSARPLHPGLHTSYNGADNGKQDREVELILKRPLSSDCSLQFESMKSESVVIANQQVAVNTFSLLVQRKYAPFAYKNKLV